MSDPIWILPEAALQIHLEQIEEHGGSHGVRDEGLLASALARPRHLRAYQSNASLAALAAAYCYGIARNHPFVDGNKRTAAVVCETFLRINGATIRAGDEAWCEVMLAVAAGEWDEGKLDEWLTSHIA